ncbi:hypothetical protein F2P81_008107, partial [Scophthalmus maximus]
MDQASGGEDPNKPSKKKSSEDEGKNKKLRDRITSFRKTGTKKEKPLIQHPTDPLSTQTELPVPQPLFDDRSMNLSEKEIIDLFEKMMEDMNLNEERKAPLRGKDLSTKREMVVQYISATAKSLPSDHYDDSFTASVSVKIGLIYVTSREATLLQSINDPRSGTVKVDLFCTTVDGLCSSEECSGDCDADIVILVYSKVGSANYTVVRAINRSKIKQNKILIAADISYADISYIVESYLTQLCHVTSLKSLQISIERSTDTYGHIAADVLMSYLLTRERLSDSVEQFRPMSCNVDIIPKDSIDLVYGHEKAVYGQCLWFPEVITCFETRALAFLDIV